MSTASLSEGAKPKKLGLLRKIWRVRQAYFFLIPVFAVLGTFKYGPLVVAVQKSFFDWNGANVDRFVGFANYAKVLHDASFRGSIGHALALTAGALAETLTLPLLAAVLVFHIRRRRLAEWVRVLFIVPLIVPALVVIKIWTWVYASQNGILNSLLELVGLDGWTHAWLGESGTSLWALVLYNFPWIGGIYFLIYLAGLLNIKAELFESGSLDGMGVWQRFRYLELPLIRGQIRLVALLVVIGQLQNFELPLILTGGGPGESSLTPALYLYDRAFTYNEMGYASALGMVLCVGILIVTQAIQKVFKSSETSG
ncbi:carbohydrate ABC transporter permease [Paenibacillus sacheonensis]|uniref:ABC transporter permease subunit n=1 Tax=Paenibacillus sacheonensis TaxID=742054 RepID=A0A7X4YQX8_9BACL|nr:sugar ABC transporter permease [Paenibacillus sacheonensis]MBM7567191.1 raffinose/stachyose/melibiose transport system permease protein [Paenibacillus sacheonensis]NBC70883.1 ABC transporter permease subunit [Paenibacillus sacheonensis]